jgi:hypothetical protein
MVNQPVFQLAKRRQLWLAGEKAAPSPKMEDDKSDDRY